MTARKFYDLGKEEKAMQRWQARKEMTVGSVQQWKDVKDEKCCEAYKECNSISRKG